jgi:hypothetical protein
MCGVFIPLSSAAMATTTDSTEADVQKKGEISVAGVTLGHIFALRPKVNTSFPQAQFLSAKRDLVDERYESLEGATRAVAEKALAAVNKKPGKRSLR